MTTRQKDRERFVQRTARNLPQVTTRAELRTAVYSAVCSGEADRHLDKHEDWADSALPEWRAVADAADFADPTTLGDWPGYSLASLQMILQDVLDSWIECNGEPKE